MSLYMPDESPRSLVILDDYYMMAIKATALEDTSDLEVYNSKATTQAIPITLAKMAMTYHERATFP